MFIHELAMKGLNNIIEHNMNGTNNAKNVLASDVEIKGNIKFSGELSFDGKLEGEIHTDGILTLGDSAAVNGNITAQSVIVRGKVNGNVNAKEKIEIKAKAELFGDIRATKLVVEEGVTFVGKTEVNPNKLSPTPLPPLRQGESPKIPDLAKAGGR
jgi:cytoskeletal protein CcmA (bactofilin family)